MTAPNVVTLTLSRDHAVMVASQLGELHRICRMRAPKVWSELAAMWKLRDDLATAVTQTEGT